MMHSVKRAASARIVIAGGVLYLAAGIATLAHWDAVAAIFTVMTAPTLVTAWWLAFGAGK